MKVNRPSEKKLKENLESWKSESSGDTEGVDGDESVFDRAVSRETIEMLDMEVQDLVVEIKKRGSLLTDKPTIEKLHEYKQAMATFLKKSLALSKEVKSIQGRRSIDDIRQGNEEKTHRIIDTIDERMDDLTESIVEKEQDRVEVTDMVNEIKGLVVDLVSEVEQQADEAL
jgi:uncharacterized protein YaaR (DUF327 family)